MKRKSLNDIVEMTQRYFSHEHPEIDLSDEQLGAELVILYGRLMEELEEVDAHLIRHRAQSPLGEWDLTMEIERVGLYSGFCLHIEQDDSLIASWTEKRFQVD